MLVTLAIQRLPPGDFRATAPDFPGCVVTDREMDSAIARLRLAIEGILADRFLAGLEIPAVHSAAHWRRLSQTAGIHWHELHINIAHIEAVARHQRGR